MLMTIKDALAEVGMKQKELAELSGVNIRQINSLATGASRLENTTGKNLLAIASALGMTVEELMLGQDEPSAKITLTGEADDLPPEERAAILKYEKAKDYSGWRQYPTTCGRLVDRIPTEWWDKYSARHIGEVMRLLERSFSDGLDRGRAEK